jgi:hypothetical protein
VQGAGGAVEGEQSEQPGRAERFAWNRRTQQPDRPLISLDSRCGSCVEIPVERELMMKPHPPLPVVSADDP